MCDFPCSNRNNQLNFSAFKFETDRFNVVLGLSRDLCSLAKAVAYSYKTPEIDMESEFYLSTISQGNIRKTGGKSLFKFKEIEICPASVLSVEVLLADITISQGDCPRVT